MLCISAPFVLVFFCRVWDNLLSPSHSTLSVYLFFLLFLHILSLSLSIQLFLFILSVQKIQTHFHVLFIDLEKCVHFNSLSIQIRFDLVVWMGFSARNHRFNLFLIRFFVQSFYHAYLVDASFIKIKVVRMLLLLLLFVVSSPSRIVCRCKFDSNSTSFY